MKFTLGWLKEYLETDATLDAVVDKLTALGLEVEEVVDRSARLKPFVVAEVITAEQHPNADRLRLCTVNTGSGTVQVVCGAPNARAGMKGVFAPSGAYIPGSDMTLKPTEIRGVASEGMLCSERELELSDEHDGIIELPADAPVGESYARYAGLDDPVIEIAITPNRQDCLGVYGIARDLAAAGLGTLKGGTVEPVPGTFKSPLGVTIDRSGAEICPLFAGRYIRGIRNGASPAWMQARLKAIGLRPISALVDITNYVMFDRARPLHVYDADKVKGGIIVRSARDGETFLALDGNRYTMSEGMCAIADEAGALGLGGIMGGEESGCTMETVNVFLESAWFDPVRTAMTGRQLGLESDARYRFERGVDPAFTVSGIELATRLILEICGGEASEVVVAGAAPNTTKTVDFRPDRVAALGGLDVSVEESKTILSALGFKVMGSGSPLQVSVPSWRSDIDGEADLVEEVLRVRGYDAIPAVPLAKGSLNQVHLTSRQKRTRMARRAAAARGLNEAVTWSFLGAADARLFGGETDRLRIDNPINAELNIMRPNLLPNLIKAAGRNVDRGFRNLGLFEVGNQFADDTPAGQSMVVAGIRRGNTAERHWAGESEPVDAFHAKADALAVLEAAGAPVANLQTIAEAPDWYHPGRSGTLRLGPKVLAAFGELHPRVLKALDVAGPVVGFEVFLDAIPLPKAKKGGAGRSRGPLKVSDYQAVDRDFAFIVKRDVAAETLLRAVRGVDKLLVREVSVFDVYEGEGMAEDEKSVAIRVRLQADDRTLTDKEIDTVAAGIVDAVATRTNGRLRS
ncbi:MAG: phenylalanine--tRNA ligase subunit beta [Alphaproteobacteria bacterium]|nr:MAG: phenylalanine--tRNA ligase subunit beta [Alphaproteobacteria bacterium]